VTLTLLLGTVQLLARLHHTTVATAVLTDAARSVAEAPPGHQADAQRNADARLRLLLGPAARFDWDVDASTIRLEVRLPGVVRAAVVRRERR
jgi:hypothetical protein